MNESQKKWVGYLLLVAVLILASVLGVSYPIPPPPAESPFVIVGAPATSRAASIAANGWTFDPALKTMYAESGAALTMKSGSTFTGAGTNTFTGAANFTGGLAMSSSYFSGTTHFGAAASVVSGTQVLHGWTTTPTVVIVTPLESTGWFTSSVQPFVMAITSTGFTVGVVDNYGFTKLYWMAAK